MVEQKVYHTRASGVLGIEGANMTDRGRGRRVARQGLVQDIVTGHSPHLRFHTLSFS